MPKRTTTERADHTRRRLATEPNVWVATASVDGDPHLVPLSLAWIGDQIVVATPSATPTARNAAANGRGRATLDSADDVAIFDVTIDVVDYGTAAQTLIDGYVERVGWDPGDNDGEWSLLILTLQRGQAWIGPGEISGRTIIRNGSWLA